MENEQPPGTDSPFWVILSPLGHFISSHDTLVEAEAAARHLNQHAGEPGRLQHYTTKPRPQLGA